MELVRQRIMQKSQIKPDMAFMAVDKEDKGYMTLDDMRTFLKAANMYPSEKCMKLFFARLDVNDDGVASYDEFVTAITPLQP